jgi:hypothetical protein
MIGLSLIRHIYFMDSALVEWYIEVLSFDIVRAYP